MKRIIGRKQNLLHDILKSDPSKRCLVFFFYSYSFSHNSFIIASQSITFSLCVHPVFPFLFIQSFSLFSPHFPISRISFECFSSTIFLLTSNKTLMEVTTFTDAFKWGERLWVFFFFIQLILNEMDHRAQMGAVQQCFNLLIKLTLPEQLI